MIVLPVMTSVIIHVPSHTMNAFAAAIASAILQSMLLFVQVLQTSTLTRSTFHSYMSETPILSGLNLGVIHTSDKARSLQACIALTTNDLRSRQYAKNNGIRTFCFIRNLCIYIKT